MRLHLSSRVGIALLALLVLPLELQYGLLRRVAVEKTVDDAGRYTETDVASAKGSRRHHPSLASSMPHPHAGAKDEYGNWGYIHDPTFLSRNPKAFFISNEERTQICAPPGQGPEGGKETHQFMTQELSVLPSINYSSSLKLFCSVYTYPGGVNMTQAVLETWGSRCDGFLAASTMTDASRGMVHIPHGGSHFGTYDGIWQKVRSMMTYVYTQYGDEYDYFHFNGDDTFLIVENLKAFLHDKRPPYAGRWMMPSWSSEITKSHPDFYYLLGGPGYTLSRNTLRMLVEEVLPWCHNTTDNSAEDFFVGNCLWEAGIRGSPDWDESGAHRYHPVGIEYYRNGYFGNRFWIQAHGRLSLFHTGIPTMPAAVESIVSKTSVSFHLVDTPAKIRRMEKLLYRKNEPDCL